MQVQDAPSQGLDGFLADLDLGSQDEGDRYRGDLGEWFGNASLVETRLAMYGWVGVAAQWPRPHKPTCPAPLPFPRCVHGHPFGAATETQLGSG